MRAPETVTVVSSKRPLGLRVRLGVKRTFDLLVASLTVLVMLPVMAVIAVLILVSSGRPILFRQVRVGRDGEEFTMLKYRTMAVDAEAQLDEVSAGNARSGPLFKRNDDPRVTPIGRILRRSSLDELPQLFNVIGGSMSLVGPRPALPREVVNFPPELRARETLPQGLTGLWQVENRTDAHFSKYIESDLAYVENWSLHLDLWILLRTPFAVVKHALCRSEVEAPAAVSIIDLPLMSDPAAISIAEAVGPSFSDRDRGTRSIPESAVISHEIA